MAAHFELYPVEEEIYSKTFELLCDCANGEPVHLYSECRRNMDAHGSNDYFLLELFYSVGDYADREYLIGLAFGVPGMSKTEIDQVIVTYIEDQLDDTMSVRIAHYNQKEALMENWLDQEYPQSTM